MSKGALRYSSPATMPAGMRALHDQQHAAAAPGWVPSPAKKRSGKKRSGKYNAQPTEADGIRFDSKAEARYYIGLKDRVAAGLVRYFLRQVSFPLPGGTRYVVDFMEVHADGSIHWIDVKGVETPMFRLKKKQVEDLYPVEIEVSR